MVLDKIISLANNQTRLQFLAMERSLRKVGCSLPIWVIPYDDNIFDLPNGSIWWKVPEVVSFLSENNAWPACRKYQCFLTDNYQFVDSDVIFLKNPCDVLSNLDGFVSSCTHWNNPGHTYTDESLKFLKENSTTWEMRVFNSGQWACDRKLYTIKSLMQVCLSEYKSTLLYKTHLYKDQPAINLLVNISNIDISNLTLYPYQMQSTWAGHYLEEGYENKYWKDRHNIPYLVHWAGLFPSAISSTAIDKLFFSYLSDNEIKEWQEIELKRKKRNISSILNAENHLKLLKRAAKKLLRAHK